MERVGVAGFVPRTAEIVFDEVDAALMAERAVRRALIPGVRVGDFCVMADGSVRRFTHHWGDSLQVTYEDMPGSFHCCWNGALSYSGALAPSVPVSSLQLREGLQDGACWIFHHDLSGAHRGVSGVIPCRVYEVVS